MRSPLVLASALFLVPAALAQVPTEHCGVAVLTQTNAGVLCPSNVAGDASRALDLSGAGTGTYYVSLCGADFCAITLGVTVIDGPGPDLQIEEVNPNTAETYNVEVSADGSVWYPAGFGYAGDVAIDISGTGTATVNHVKLIGATATVTGTTPGPDIDAVIAINYLPPLFGGSTRPYADLVVSYNQGVTVTSPYIDPSKALGIPNAYRWETWLGPGTTTFSGFYDNFVSMGQGAVLVLSFSNDYIIDGPGGDLIVHEYYSAEGGLFTVEASDDGVHWGPMTLVGSVSPTHGAGMTLTNNVQSFDLGGSGYLSADFIRITSIATSGAGTTPGGEIDALEAVYSTPKTRKLVVGSPLTTGGSGTIVLTAPGSVGELAIIAPAVLPPLAPGAGLIFSPGVEFRLDLTDPVLNFVLFDPLGPLIVSGNIGPVPMSPPEVTTTVNLPFSPSLLGLVLYWHGVLVSGSTVTGTTNILHSRIQ